MLDRVFDWFKKPFDKDGSAVNWILFAGLLIIAAFFWQQVLAAIKD